MYSISKVFKFSAAHRLQGHSGLCKNVHGHNFVVKIEYAGSSLKEDGMLMDFQDLNPIRNWLNENWDHSYLCEQSDKIGDVLAGEGMRVYRFHVAPTTEYLCRYLANVCEKFLGNTPSLIEIQETDLCTASRTQK